MKKHPINPLTDRELFDEDFAVISATECTGLAPTPPLTDAEVESYTHIYNVPLAKSDEAGIHHKDGHLDKKKARYENPEE